MSNISRDEVAKLAKLARIEMTADELDHLSTQLAQILDSVARVSEVAREDIKPTSHAIEMKNVFRKDEVKPSLAPSEALSGAPAQEDGRFRVPQILGEAE